MVRWLTTVFKMTPVFLPGEHIIWDVKQGINSQKLNN
jgi:hypothetical protein